MAYIVKRTIDNDKAGADTHYFVKVEKPSSGDTICHGEFKPYNVNLDVGCEERWAPVGEHTEEAYRGDVETF